MPEMETHITELKNKEWKIRKGAAYSLGSIGHPDAIPHLVKALKNENEGTVKLVIVEALGKIGDPIAIPSLEKALENGNWEVRQQTAIALGELGHPDAIPYLVKALQDKRKWVRVNSATALGRIGDPKAVPSLITTLNEEEDKDVKCVAAEALGKIKHLDAVPHLTNALDDEDHLVRNTSIYSLGQIGGEEAIQVLVQAHSKVKGDNARVIIENALKKIEKEAKHAN